MATEKIGLSPGTPTGLVAASAWEGRDPHPLILGFMLSFSLAPISAMIHHESC